MDFSLPEELRMLRDTVARFVKQELIPLEREVIRREAERGLTDAPLVAPEAEQALNRKAKEIGLYGIDVPEEYGGQNLGMLAKAVVIEELKTSITPYVLPPDSPNLYMLRETCKGDQIGKYFIPYAKGEKKSAIAITEPGALAERFGGRQIIDDAAVGRLASHGLLEREGARLRTSPAGRLVLDSILAEIAA